MATVPSASLARLLTASLNPGARAEHSAASSRSRASRRRLASVSSTPAARSSADARRPCGHIAAARLRKRAASTARGFGASQNARACATNARAAGVGRPAMTAESARVRHRHQREFRSRPQSRLAGYSRCKLAGVVKHVGDARRHVGQRREKSARAPRPPSPPPPPPSPRPRRRPRPRSWTFPGSETEANHRRRRRRRRRRGGARRRITLPTPTRPARRL